MVTEFFYFKEFFYSKEFQNTYINQNLKIKFFTHKPPFVEQRIIYLAEGSYILLISLLFRVEDHIFWYIPTYMWMHTYMH